MKPTKPHAILLASPGMGHLIPVLELGKRLANHNEFKVTIFVVSSSHSESQLLKSSSSSTSNLLNIVSLPPADISHLVDQNTHIVTQIAIMMRMAVSSLRSKIAAMKLRPTMLIVDLFGTEAMAVADDFRMLKYVFITSTAWFLAVTIYTPTLGQKAVQEHVENRTPLRIPGCKPVRFEDQLEAFLDPTDRMYGEFVRVGMEMTTADGILVNTWQDLEPTTISALQDGNYLGRFCKAPVYPIGPLVRPVEPDLESKVLNWLDRQPSESVIYVSFGSGGTLSAAQTTELAWGLELSHQRFVWVLRPPFEKDASGTFFTVSNGHDSSPDFLPDGFLTRTRERGLVVPMWAPQAEILAHPSVNGFLSHCGWNSTLESITNGVPMIAWPLYAEQKMNARMLSEEEIGVAVRTEVLSSVEVVGREEIGKMVKEVMGEEGHGMRERVKELKYSAEKAWREGGSSFHSLSQLAKDCESSMQSLKSMAKGA